MQGQDRRSRIQHGGQRWVGLRGGLTRAPAPGAGHPPSLATANDLPPPGFLLMQTRETCAQLLVLKTGKARGARELHPWPGPERSCRVRSG